MYRQGPKSCEVMKVREQKGARRLLPMDDWYPNLAEPLFQRISIDTVTNGISAFS